MIYPGGDHPALTNYVRKFDSVQFIIDHVGMGVDRAALPGQLETTIDNLLAYSKYPNVAVKWGHAPRLSREPFPNPKGSRGFESPSLHHSVRWFSYLSENRSKNARVRAIRDHAWTRRASPAA
jgi:hypothetical protein